MAVLWLLALCLGASAEGTLSTLPTLKVPLYADPRQPVQLGCFYPELPPDYTISAAKWLRNRYTKPKEIMRFNKKREPRIMKYDQGVDSVDSYTCDETQCVIGFKPFLSDHLSGNYSCEVFYDGPDPGYVIATAPMNVAALPSVGPVILGAPSSANPGQELVLNCTSDYSYPPPVMNWYINHEHYQPGNVSNNIGAVSPPRPDGLKLSWRSIRVKAAAAEDRREMILHCESIVEVHPLNIKRTIKLLPIRRRSQDAP